MLGKVSAAELHPIPTGAALNSKEREQKVPPERQCHLFIIQKMIKKVDQ